jgi:hypothetical protein
MPTRDEFQRRWVELILSVDLPERDVIKDHLEAAESIDFCECGCHSFDLDIPQSRQLTPLCDGRRLFSEFTFNTNFEEVLDVILFTDERGYLRSVDITYGMSNHAAIPVEIEVRSFGEFLGRKS